MVNHRDEWYLPCGNRTWQLEIPPYDGRFIYWENHLKIDDFQLQRLIL